MKFNISLYNRLLSAIAVLSLIILIFSIYLTRQIKDKDRLTSIISDDFQPSITSLAGLTDKFQESKNLVIYWGNAGATSDMAFRDKLELLFQTEINFFLEELTVLSVKWNPEDLELFKSTAAVMRDSLFYSYTDIVREYRIAQAESGSTTDMGEFIEQQDILFLLSEVEQNLSYMLDKRKTDMKTNFSLIEENALRIRKTIIMFTILIIAMLLVFSAWTFMFIRRSVNQLNSQLGLLTQGIIPSHTELIRKDEMGTVLDHMNKLFAYLKNLTIVAQKINQKEFNNDFKPLSEKDELGIALLNLQNNLKQASEETMRRIKEDMERSWTAGGIAKINDILRISSDRLEDLAFQLIREIAGFTSSQVGALYILNDKNKSDVFAEMIAAFAYDRQKFINKKISVGEGLVGRCIQENETVYLTEVPENYLSVKSGLGESKPLSILIVPLHLNENVYGVIELASFSKFEPYQIHFVETIGESIASSISKVKINLQTTHLLEQTRQQAEEMTTQEEEMRQNMEELRSTQEQSSVREERLRKEIEVLKGKIKLNDNLKI
jgi:GAF domain-containing protein